MAYKKMLDRILHEYPEFIDKSSDSNIHKYEKSLASEYKKLETSAYIVELSKDLDRPIKLWKNQYEPYRFSMQYMVILPNIKQVKFCSADGTVLQDSGVLALGTTEYEDEYFATSETIVPTEKYYLEVEDHMENVFYKGFPENDTKLGDKYDHDEALDIIGDLLLIPRRKHRAVIDEELAETFPTYCNTATECDYIYELRIKRHMEGVDEDPLPELELEKLFEISPEIIGRWHYLCQQNVHLQDKMFMLTDNWHPSVIDVLVNLSNVPTNIDVPSGYLINDILDKTSPLCKKALFQFISSESIDMEALTLAEYISLRNFINWEAEIIAEYVEATVTVPMSEGIGFVEDLKLSLSNNSNDCFGLVESIVQTIHGLQGDYSSSTQMNTGVFDDTYVEGSGDTAKIRIDTATKGTGKYPTANDQPAEDGCDDFWWTNPERVYANDNNWAHTTPSSSGWMRWLRGYNFNFGIPTNAQITGLFMRCKHSNNGANHWFNYKLWVGAETSKFAYPNTTPWGSGSATTYTGTMEWAIGGDGNRLGISAGALTPANVNAMKAGFASSIYTSGRTVYLDYIYVAVYWRYNSGIFTTPAIAFPDADSWDKIEIDHTIPSGTTITYQVLKASDNSVLKTSTSNEIDISDLDNVDIKVKASMTANGATTPYINSIKVYSIKTE